MIDPESSSQAAFEWRSNRAHHGAQTKMGQLRSYYEWVVDCFGGDFAQPVVDAGAGSGHLAGLLLAAGVSEMVLLEGGRENLEVLAAKFAGDQRVAVVDCDLATCAEVLGGREVGSIVTLDVIEHLRDDVAVLRQFHAALPPGGRLYVKVPAHAWLYGEVDRASGHHRRYSKTSLRTALEGSGFVVERCRYINLAGVLPYFVKSRVLRRSSNFSRTFSATRLRRIDRAMPVIRALDKLTFAPVGLSVLAVARRPL